jgi:hypothetical protein
VVSDLFGVSDAAMLEVMVLKHETDPASLAALLKAACKRRRSKS